MTYSEVIAAYPALCNLCRLRMPVPTAQKVYALYKALKSEYEFFASEEGKRVEAYAEQDEHGNLIKDQYGRVKMRSVQAAEEYQREMDDLKNAEISAVIEPVSISLTELEDQRITPEMMLALEGLVSYA